MEEFLSVDRVKLRNLQEIKKFKYNDEGQKTATSKEQIKVESSIELIFDRFEQLAALDPSLPLLNRKKHAEYLETIIRRLPTSFECLDASRPWLVYWILNAASLLGLRFSESTYDDVVDFLTLCRNPNGGFGGGPGQIPHLAPTYAAVNALVIVGTEKALDAIEKNSLKQFFLTLREPNGSFRMHDDGEVDVRGAYCAISSAKLINVSNDDEAILFKDTANWIAECQTYEGGFGGCPGLEAHGGYSFCAAASLAMLGHTAHTDLSSLLRWSVNRQMTFEGGFQGRTNKLVDGCYSFWQGVLVPIVQALISKENYEISSFMKQPLFHREALQEYILICCQRPSGGLIDKPGKPADPYHTCYTLSGLSISQHCDIGADPLVLGSSLNELLPTHPVHNVPPKAVLRAYVHFQYNDPNERLTIASKANTRESSANTFEQMFKTPSEFSNREGSNENKTPSERASSYTMDDEDKYFSEKSRESSQATTDISSLSSTNYTNSEGSHEKTPDQHATDGKEE